MYYSECVYYPLPFYATQIINPFLTSRISANLGKGESLYSLMFLQCRISFMLRLPTKFRIHVYYSNKNKVYCNFVVVFLSVKTKIWTKQKPTLKFNFDKSPTIEMTVVLLPVSRKYKIKSKEVKVIIIEWLKKITRNIQTTI